MIWLCIAFLMPLQKRAMDEFDEVKLHIDGAGEITSALTVTEQADLLPYDTSYDFKRQDLKLGVRLGVGAFGEVLLAEATNIVGTEPSTMVAVKRVKNSNCSADLRALIMEMKIMIHLGKHLNVLNLLGVVRENLEKS